MTVKKFLLSPIFLAVISGIASGIVGSVIITSIQSDSFEKELTELKIQNDILSDTLLDQQEQTQILNQTLQNLKKSIEKESLISVKVLPRTEELHSPFGVGVRAQISGANYTREAYQITSAIPLKAFEKVTFDIIITNVGSDTAVLNQYAVETVVSTPEGTNSWATHYRDIREILRSGEVLIIPFELEIEPNLKPYGDIFFTVVHDNGIDESYSLKYYYDE